MSKGQSAKPAITGAEGLLPYGNLSPEEFERLCLELVMREGFERAQHLGGPGDGGRDAEAWRGERRFVFQCKRVGKFGPAAAKREIAKLSPRPDELVFVVSYQVSPQARAAIRKAWEDENTCQFWAQTELHALVHRHQDLVWRYFRRTAEAPAGPIVDLPFFSLGPHFAGREPALEALRASLHRPGGGPTAIAGKAIHGLGGVGKTRLALEYGWRFLGEYAAVLFADASSAANLAPRCQPIRGTPRSQGRDSPRER